MLKIDTAAEPAYRAVMPFFLPMTDTQRSLYTAQDAMDELVERAEDCQLLGAKASELVT